MAAGAAPVLALAQDATGGPRRVLDTRRADGAGQPGRLRPPGTIKLKATFPNAQHRLWPGGFVSVRLRTEVARDAIVVPPSAIQRGPRGPYVFVIGAENTAKRQQVSVGMRTRRRRSSPTVLSPGIRWWWTGLPGWPTAPRWRSRNRMRMRQRCPNSRQRRGPTGSMRAGRGGERTAPPVVPPLVMRLPVMAQPVMAQPVMARLVMARLVLATYRRTCRYRWPGQAGP